MANGGTGSPSESLSTRGSFALGLYMLALPILLVYLLLRLWPTAKPDTLGNIPDATISLFGSGTTFTIPLELQLLLLVAVAGALGGFVHNATSFADYAGNRRLVSSWTWWYVLRPFISLSLALIFYFVIRGGLISQTTNAKDVSPYGVTAIAGLVGMFAKQATDKLEELFSTLFKTSGDNRADKLQNPKPQIDKLEPAEIKSGCDATVKILGNNFVAGAQIRFKNTDRQTTYTDTTHLEFKLTAAELTTPEEVPVLVVNPAPGGGASNQVLLKIT